MKKLLTIITGLITLWAVSASAEEAIYRMHTFAIGPELSYRDYREPDPANVEEKGWMYGLNGYYAYHNGLMLKAQAVALWGDVDYSNSGTKTNSDYMLEGRGLAGYDLPAYQNDILTPYIGIGYRYLNDDFRGATSTGARGYLRETGYTYLPVGLDNITRMDSGWLLSENLEFDVFLLGSQKSHLSDAIAGLNDIENKQHSGYGLRGDLMLHKELQKNVIKAVEGGILVRYWKVGTSDMQDLTYFGSPTGIVVFEPKNHSTEVGARVAVKF